MRVIVIVLLAVTAAAPALAQPPPPPPPPPPSQVLPSGRDLAAEPVGTAVIAGRVLSADASARPVRRAAVRLSGSSLPSGRILMTDAEGRFAFTGLPAGSYSMTVSKPGWVNGFYGARNPWSSPGTPVVVAGGERLADLDVRLAPGAVISGRIYNQFGQPQAGVRVIALERRRYAGQDQFMRARASSGLTAQTDDRGDYRLYGLPPGEFYLGAGATSIPRSTTTLTTPEEVRWAEQLSRAGLTGGIATPPPGPSVTYAPVYYPGVTDPAAGAAIAVTMGEERTGADFQLQFVRTASVRGTITLPDGSPAVETTLLMTSTSGVDISTSIIGGGPLNRASVNRDGSFEFQSITPGEYFITARASSQPAARGRGAGPRSQPVMDLWAGETVNVGGDDVDGLAIQLQPGLNIRGRLAFDGTVLEPPDDLSRATVRLMPAETQSVSVGVAPTEVSADGTFVVEGVAPGSYLISATTPALPGGPASARWYPSTALIDGVNAVEVPFEVRPGRDISDVVIEFTDKSTSLTGQVTDAEGRPVQGLTMLLFRRDPATWSTALGARYRRTVPLDSNGRYRVPLMPPGDYLLAALAEVDQADLADPAYLEQVAQSAIPVTLTLGEDTVQDIRIGGAGGTGRDWEGLYP